MTERQKFILRAALIYLQSNLDDASKVFGRDKDRYVRLLDVNGDVGEEIDEDEVGELLMELQ